MAVGSATAVGSLIAFAAAGIGTIIGLTALGTLGDCCIRGPGSSAGANAITAPILVAIGALVLAGAV